MKIGRSWILSSALLFGSFVSMSSAFAGDASFRNDFDGTWRNSYGQIIRITQSGMSGAVVEDVNISRVSYELVFGSRSTAPKVLAESFVRSGSYLLNLGVSPTGSILAGEADFVSSWPEATVRVTAHVEISVGKRKDPLEASCEDAFVPRVLSFKVTELSAPDFKLYEVPLGFSDSFTEIDPRTAESKSGCNRLDQESSTSKDVPWSPDAVSGASVSPGSAAAAR